VNFGRVCDATIPVDPLYRIAWTSDSTQFPPLEYVGDGRFDDPEGEYRVIYASVSSVGAYVETLQDFRPPLNLVSKIRDLPGMVDRTWHSPRWMGCLRILSDQRFLDARRLETNDFFRRELAEDLLCANLESFDVSLPGREHRHLTQKVSRWAYDNGYKGIVFRSQFREEFTSWAIFEGTALTQGAPSRPIKESDSDFVEALNRMQLLLASQNLEEKTGEAWRIHLNRVAALA
jgi:RES domain